MDVKKETTKATIGGNSGFASIPAVGKYMVASGIVRGVLTGDLHHGKFIFSDFNPDQNHLSTNNRDSSQFLRKNNAK